MARLFDDAASEYLQHGSAVTGNFPLSFACWFNVDTNNAIQYMIYIADSSVTNQAFALGIDIGGKVITLSYAAGTSAASSTIASTLNTWHHACGVIYSATLRAAYLDGGYRGTDVVNRAPAGLDATSIARACDSSPGYHVSGALAEVTVWDTALRDADIVRMGRLGYPPWRVQPDHVVGFWLPFADRTDRDFSGRGHHMTAYNTPTWRPDPPRIIEVLRLR